MTTNRTQFPLFVAAMVILACLPSLAQEGADMVDAGPEPITIHLFYSPTCAHCHEVRAAVARMADDHEDIVAVEHTLADPKNIELMAQYYLDYGVPEEQWGGTVAAFAGDRWWSDADAILSELEGATSKMTGKPGAAGASEPEDDAAAGADGNERLVGLFRTFGVATIAAAGLVDGINPCALATLIFLISYLSLRERSAREVLATGLLFAAGVFLAYLAIGIGALRALQELEGLSAASRWLYSVMAVGTFILAVLSFRDAVRARRGDDRGMTLKLPPILTRLSHRLVRMTASPGIFLGFAFFAGMAIAVLELFCTGQIYLPTLMYVWGEQQMRARALGLLILYVGMFTLPIVALSIVAYAGTSSGAIVAYARKHTTGVKLAMALLFLTLTGYLVLVG